MKIVFFGTPDFAARCLDALQRSSHEIGLVVAQPDRKAGRGMKLTRPAVATRAAELGLPLVQPAKIRTPDFLDRIRECDAGLGVVVAYGRILPAELLSIPAHGFINVHGSLLPKYRGAAPIQRAIEAGETETGVTIMRVDEELDHGPIFSMSSVAIGPDETSPEIFGRLADVGAGLLVSTIDAIEDGSAEETPQDHASATVASMIRREEGRVDWNESARRIYDRYRAFEPWPGIHARIGAEDVKLKKVRPNDRSGAPGTVMDIGNGAVVVACGEGSIVIERGQRPGKREVSGAELASSLGIEEGSRIQ